MLFLLYQKISYGGLHGIQTHNLGSEDRCDIHFTNRPIMKYNKLNYK